MGDNIFLRLLVVRLQSGCKNGLKCYGRGGRGQNLGHSEVEGAGWMPTVRKAPTYGAGIARAQLSHVQHEAETSTYKRLDCPHKPIPGSRCSVLMLRLAREVVDLPLVLMRTHVPPPDPLA